MYESTSRGTRPATASHCAPRERVAHGGARELGEHRLWEPPRPESPRAPKHEQRRKRHHSVERMPAVGLRARCRRLPRTEGANQGAVARRCATVRSEPTLAAELSFDTRNDGAREANPSPARTSLPGPRTGRAPWRTDAENTAPRALDRALPPRAGTTPRGHGDMCGGLKLPPKTKTFTYARSYARCRVFHPGFGGGSYAPAQ